MCSTTVYLCGHIMYVGILVCGWHICNDIWPDRHVDLPESLHCPSTFLLFPGMSQTDSCTVSVEQSMCTCVLITLSLRLLQKGQEAAADTLTLPPLSSLLVISPAAQFIFPNTAAEDQRTAGAWLGSREETRGIEGWRKKEKRGGGSEDSFVRLSSCILVLL